MESIPLHMCAQHGVDTFLLIHPDLGEVKPIGKGVAGNGRV